MNIEVDIKKDQEIFGNSERVGIGIEKIWIVLRGKENILSEEKKIPKEKVIG